MSSEGVYGIAVSGRSARPVALGGCGVWMGGVETGFGAATAGFGDSTGRACCFTSGFDCPKSAEVKRATARSFFMAAKSIAPASDGAATPVLSESSLARTTPLRLQVIAESQLSDPNSSMQARFVCGAEVDATVKTTERRFGGGCRKAREVAGDTGQEIRTG